MSRRAAALCCCLTAFIAAPVLAESDLEPPDLAEYLRWGPVRVRPGFAVTNFGYDSNIFFNDQPDVGTLTATFTPKLRGLLLLGSRAFLTFDERFSYRAYLDYSDQNYYNNFTEGRLTVPFGKFGLFSELQLERANFRPVDREDTRAVGQTRSLAFGAIVEPSTRTSIELTYRGRRLRFQDPDDTDADTLGVRLNRDEIGTKVDFGYRIWGRSRLLVVGATNRVDFLSNWPIGDIPRDTREWLAESGLEFGRGGRLTGKLLAGWAVIDAESPELPDFRGAVGSAELRYRITSQTELRVEGLRRPGFAVSGANSYYLESAVGLGVVHFLNRIFGLEAGGRRGRLTFPEGSDRVDIARWYEAGVRLRLFTDSIGRRTEYRIKIRRYTRESTIPLANQNQTTFSFDAVVGF